MAVHAPITPALTQTPCDVLDDISCLLEQVGGIIDTIILSNERWEDGGGLERCEMSALFGAGRLLRQISEGVEAIYPAVSSVKCDKEGA